METVGSKTTQPIVRRVEPSDAQAVLDLQNLTFIGQRSPELLQWKTSSNPYTQDLSAVAVLEDKIVGYYVIIALQLNFCGKPILSGQASDTIVHPDFRQSGLFKPLMETCFGYAAKQGAAFVFGFPNAKVLAMNIHRVAVPIATLSFYRRSCSVRSRAKAIFKSSLLSSLLNRIYVMFLQCSYSFKSLLLSLECSQDPIVSRSDSLAPDYDSLWNAVKESEIFSVWKDSGYLNWRYLMHPSIKPAFFYCRVKDELVAMAVVQEKSGSLFISELMVKGKSLAIGRLLVNRVVQYCLSKKLESVCFVGHDRGFFKALLTDFSHDPAKDYIMVGRILTDDSRIHHLLSNDRNWCLTAGDTDSLY